MKTLFFPRHKDGTRLRSSRKAVMTLSHDGTAELNLGKVTKKDAGIYTCTASNEVGKAETTAKVSVVGKDEYIEGEDDSSPQVYVNPPDIGPP